MNENKENKEPEEATDEPVLDGATEADATEADTDEVDPRKGQADPALIRHPDKGDKNKAPYNL
ncbi:MAG: hypothetical protein ACTHZ9_05105 [Leucobacter sp.]